MAYLIFNALFIYACVLRQFYIKWLTQFSFEAVQCKNNILNMLIYYNVVLFCKYLYVRYSVLTLVFC